MSELSMQIYVDSFFLTTPIDLGFVFLPPLCTHATALRPPPHRLPPSSSLPPYGSRCPWWWRGHPLIARGASCRGFPRWHCGFGVSPILPLLPKVQPPWLTLTSNVPCDLLLLFFPLSSSTFVVRMFAWIWSHMYGLATKVCQKS